MEAHAKLKYLKMTPRKVRLVADLIRGERLDKALHALTFLEKRAARPMETLLRSAAANAGNIDGINTETLFVSRIFVNEGPTMKRIMPRAMGRANVIFKRTSHVEVTLEDRPVKAAPVNPDVPAKDEDKGKDSKKASGKKSSGGKVVKKTVSKKSIEKKPVKKAAGSKTTKASKKS